MMSDALDDLKARLDVVAVVNATEPLVPRGRVWQGERHDSLKVDPGRGRWRWYSRNLGGDALAWLALQRFGRTEAAGAEFIEVVRDACAIAGMSADEFEKPSFAKASEGKRRREATLARYADLARAQLTPIRRAQAREVTKKAWLTDEVMDRWDLGFAPTAGEMRAAGLGLAELLDVGLVRWSGKELLGRGDWGVGSGESPKSETSPLPNASNLSPMNRSGWGEISAGDVYAFFRERLVIPFTERGRVVYLGGRDVSRKPIWEDGARDQPKKMLYLPGPQKDPATGEWCGGVRMPDGFNLDALLRLGFGGQAANEEAAVLLVEGPLDAIACCEAGHPAAALLSSSPSEGMIQRLRRAAT